MRMHMAIAMLCGIITMVLSDFDFLRSDILCCIVMGTLMHVFFTACAGWLALESWAAFKAVTHGIITGKLSAYVSIAYGKAQPIFSSISVYVSVPQPLAKRKTTET